VNVKGGRDGIGGRACWSAALPPWVGRRSANEAGVIRAHAGRRSDVSAWPMARRLRKLLFCTTPRRAHPTLQAVAQLEIAPRPRECLHWVGLGIGVIPARWWEVEDVPGLAGGEISGPRRAVLHGRAFFRRSGEAYRSPSAWQNSGAGRSSRSPLERARRLPRAGRRATQLGPDAPRRQIIGARRGRRCSAARRLPVAAPESELTS